MKETLTTILLLPFTVPILLMIIGFLDALDDHPGFDDEPDNQGKEAPAPTAVIQTEAPARLPALIPAFGGAL